MVLVRLGERSKNQTELFRFLDIRGKGKVKKSEFLIAIEKARISLSREDIGKVFKKIDANNNGFFTYQDLCAAAAKKSSLDARTNVGLQERAMNNLFRQESPDPAASPKWVDIEKTYGCNNLPSDNMNQVMSNHFANEYAKAMFDA